MAELVGDTAYRAKLEEDVTIQGLRVSPKQVVGSVITKLYGKIFAHRGVRHCIDDPNGDAKIILFDRTVDAAGAQAQAALIGSDATIIAEAAKKSNGKALDVQPVSHSVHLTYKNYTVPEILGKLLPSNVVALSGFEQVGHIAHVNLSEAHLPFKFMIGQVILDCNPSIVRTVVNKVGTIESVFREFKMEVIGGDPTSLVAEVKQHGCVMRIPYDKVYWNSRLSQEHHRLVTKLKAGDELFDVMAGCGPFAIPAALKGVRVYANDLNPASVDAMRDNAKLNNVPSSKLTCYNMDGRAFVDDVLRGEFMTTPRAASVGKRHVTMNLPATAVEFLDVFTRASFKNDDVVDGNVTVHVYTFCSVTTAEEARVDALAQVAKYLGLSDVGRSLPEECIEEVTVVRDVAPKKLMVCVSFSLPKDIPVTTSPGTKRARSNE